MPLKDLQIKQLKPKEKPYKAADEKGLYLLINPIGSKLWRFKYRHGGKERVCSYGAYPEVSLSEARQNRDSDRKLIREGVDPMRAHKQQKAALKFMAENTFLALANEWHKKNLQRWNPKTAKEYRSLLDNDAIPFLGTLPVLEIKPFDVLEALRVMESRGALDRVRKLNRTIKAVFRYAIQTGRAEFNPAADLIGAIESRPVKHHNALPRDELGGFLRELATFDRGKKITKLAMRLLILSFVRSGELRGARWEEFDVEGKVWRIPAVRMKMGADHIVPLCPQALKVLEDVKDLSRGSEFLFPSDRSRAKPMSENALSYLMKRMGYQGKATPHGFRAVASTILNETGFDPDWIERQLAHVERNKVRAAYHRAEYLEDRRKMMDWWGSFIEATEKGADIVPIRREA
ncbi:MAG: tyrosine-type recombinase/integrase [Candidatus Sedimenticola sp. (ex Thyasira tokunagai)]